MAVNTLFGFKQSMRKVLLIIKMSREKRKSIANCDIKCYNAEEVEINGKQG